MILESIKERLSKLEEQVAEQNNVLNEVMRSLNALDNRIDIVAESFQNGENSDELLRKALRFLIK